MATPFEQNNQAHLQTGLAWVRTLLHQRIAASAPPVAPAPAPRQRIVFGDFGRSPPPHAPAPPLAFDPQEPARAKAAFDATAGADPAPALALLDRRFDLSAFEVHVLLLCAGLELDPNLPVLIGAAQGDPTRRAPSFALAMDLFGDAGWDALSPTRPLRGLRLVEVHQSGAMPLLAAPLRIDERIAAFIKGANYLDERLAGLVSPVAAPVSVAASHADLIGSIRPWIAPGQGAALIQLTGRDLDSKRDVAAAAAGQAGLTLLAAPAASLPSGADDIDQLARLWSREAQLLPLALLIEGVPGEQPWGGEGEAPAAPARSWAWLNRLGGAVFADVSAPTRAFGEAHVVHVDPPTPADRRELWSKALAANGAARADPKALDRLAREFSFSGSRIGAIVAAAGPDARGEGGVDKVWRACLTHAASTIDGLADRIEPRARLDDVKLADRDKEQLLRLVRHARTRGAALGEYGFDSYANRGLGLAALFHGESGTGKTMAAEAVAAELELALFRVDLSAVMSKYIGETSKNLRRIFDAADGGGAMLLFDEADAVFGRRSEVKDSHDRYANIDINYLLTRMEAFGGVTVLATNMKHALDPAFLRRLRFIIGFGFPGQAERKAIWEGVFPKGARLEALDVDRLARFPLTGGSIFNAALAAAHEAAAADHPIGMPHVLNAIRWELRKLDRPVPEREFAGVREVAQEGAAP
jgi:hypothetical protein